MKPGPGEGTLTQAHSSAPSSSRFRRLRRQSGRNPGAGGEEKDSTDSCPDSNPSCVTCSKPLASLCPGFVMGKMGTRVIIIPACGVVVKGERVDVTGHVRQCLAHGKGHMSVGFVHQCTDPKSLSGSLEGEGLTYAHPTLRPTFRFGPARSVRGCLHSEPCGKQRGGGGPAAIAPRPKIRGGEDSPQVTEGRESGHQACNPPALSTHFSGRLLQR